MNELKELLELDFKYLFIGLILLLVVIKFVWTLLEWLIVEKLGLETKKQRQRKAELKQLDDTTNLAKQTAKSKISPINKYLKSSSSSSFNSFIHAHRPSLISSL